MSWLAIETATEVGSVAIGSPGVVVAERTFAARQHGSMLMPSIVDLLREADADFGSVVGIALADGPGSFTGIRIGTATAVGIAHAREGMQFRVVPSLMAAAWRARHLANGAIAAWFDALRGEVFSAIYEFDNGVVTLARPERGLPEALMQSTAICPDIVVGSGGKAFEAQVQQWTGTAPVGPPVGEPRASAVLELLALDGAAVAYEHPSDFEPTYGRKAEAQVRWEENHGRSLPDSGSSSV